ncbi:MAG TPA: hypothetical protein VN781_02145 [Acidimicrobiales bacterium]|nr:hypothetical protein [Acidimicrobiales bacterium]
MSATSRGPRQLPLAAVCLVGLMLAACGSVTSAKAVRHVSATGTTSNHLVTGSRETTTTVPSTTTTTTAALGPLTSPPLPVAIAGFQPGVVTAIGDSVMLDAEPDLERDIPGIQVDAAVSRQWSDGEAILSELKAQGRLGAVIVIGLGTNSGITTRDFDQMMSILEGASRVVFVTVHVDAPWQDEVNAVLAVGVDSYPATVLADWEGLAEGHPEWFGADGTHMPIGGMGALALAELVARSV